MGPGNGEPHALPDLGIQPHGQVVVPARLFDRRQVRVTVRGPRRPLPARNGRFEDHHDLPRRFPDVSRQPSSGIPEQPGGLRVRRGHLPGPSARRGQVFLRSPLRGPELRLPQGPERRDVRELGRCERAFLLPYRLVEVPPRCPGPAQDGAPTALPPGPVRVGEVRLQRAVSRQVHRVVREKRPTPVTRGLHDLFGTRKRLPAGQLEAAVDLAAVRLFTGQPLRRAVPDRPLVVLCRFGGRGETVPRLQGEDAPPAVPLTGPAGEPLDQAEKRSAPTSVRKARTSTAPETATPATASPLPRSPRWDVRTSAMIPKTSPRGARQTSEQTSEAMANPLTGGDGNICGPGAAGGP
ncbi:hypothetical protein K373_01482 [Streptomyces sp. DvalAA-21]|nr:hypothetical protein SACTE_0710 [Streptomyces sp. SirexAA-E]PZX42991.1 hypothetical protein K373_01482 [Streptomyces sp. DvalAA-21]RAJ38977.1 hypothetical protein K351_00617 [Streptomyces sp. DpondAA-E10]RAJ52938.1 hypothetical protein K352_00013 [Streptomyces sp. DpondAA-A50]SCE07151.1 hypothetical protein GA0115235_111312 [Streptomyces sp. DpondAA-F4a]SCM14025.1 hypothetical protein SAMN04883147_1098245 [Streptomyces sp. DpondAA-F4]